MQRAIRVALDSWLNPHLNMRLKALAVQTAATPEEAAEVIAEGDRALYGVGACQPCSMGFRTASARCRARMKAINVGEERSSHSSD